MPAPPLVQPVPMPSGLVHGWEVVLLAAMYKDHRVRGVLRANKVLARFQREGVPVTLKFRNIEKGPACIELVPMARKAAGHGLLQIEKIAQHEEGQDDRTDFVLTESGMKYVTTVVAPFLTSGSNGDAVQRALSEGLKVIYSKTQDLIAESHDTLLLDDRAQLIAAQANVSKILHDYWSKIAAGPRPRDSMSILIGANVELAAQALEVVGERLQDPAYRWSGANHIVVKATELVGLLEEWERLKALPRMGKALQESFELILNALEVNCRVYDLVRIPTEEDIQEMLRGVPELDPDREHV